MIYAHLVIAISSNCLRVHSLKPTSSFGHYPGSIMQINSYVSVGSPLFSFIRLFISYVLQHLLYVNLLWIRTPRMKCPNTSQWSTSVTMLWTIVSGDSGLNVSTNSLLYSFHLTQGKTYGLHHLIHSHPAQIRRKITISRKELGYVVIKLNLTMLLFQHLIFTYVIYF